MKVIRFIFEIGNWYTNYYLVSKSSLMRFLAYPILKGLVMYSARILLYTHKDRIIFNHVVAWKY